MTNLNVIFYAIVSNYWLIAGKCKLALLPCATYFNANSVRKVSNIVIKSFFQCFIASFHRWSFGVLLWEMTTMGKNQ